jgi:hypothetical protein
MSGDNVIVRVNELNVNDVDPLRIAIRGDGFGNLVRFSNTGETNFPAPNQNMSFDVILFNQLGNDSLGRQVSYSWMDDQSSKLYRSKRNYVVYRKDRDGVTGPEEYWQSVFDQLNSALDLGWVKWGSITSKPMPNDGTGDFSYGYGICTYSGGRADGLHAGSYILVDERTLYGTAPIAVGLEEAFENICVVQNIGGHPSLMTIQKWGVLHQTDLFAYVFAKDNAGNTSSSGSKLSIGFMR